MLTAQDVLRRYLDEELPDFVDRPLTDVNMVGRFGSTPLHVAAVRGDAEEIRALIEGGADVNAEGELRNRPIHDAIGQQNVEAVRLLLDAGARLDGINEFGKSTCGMAMESGNQAIIDLIRSRCAGAEG